MPPAAHSLATFWKFLLRGGNALRAVPADRWDWRQFFDSDPARPGKSYAPKGAYLEIDHEEFDPLAFGISPREAAALDPQQRLLLESAWEAFEDAGLPLESIAGQKIGVFIGAFCIDQLIHQVQPSNRHLLNSHSTVGASITILSNRLSHAFDLRGPSLTLDTACSSSLVALHYACQSLRLGECDAVLTGGVNAMTRPDFPIMMSKGHFLSDHGECHPFDESAAGYARGEGAGVFVIKRLGDALRHGDRIHAIVRASGVNQDGHTDGISLPNSRAQEELVRRVYEKAGISLEEVDYIEAHGTGTQAGDPAEVGALDAVFRPHRKSKLPIGSVKSNIGHLEAAAGVAGVLKVIGLLQNRQIPKTLHFKTPNPRIPFDQYCVEVVATDRTLPSPSEKPILFAGVNSFGYGGTNAHVLLESPPEPPPVSPSPERALYCIPLSARSDAALRDLSGKVAFQIANRSISSLADLAYTHAFRRSHLDIRAVAITASLEELRDQLTSASTGSPHDGLVTGTREPHRTPVFVFTGMGPQWWAMGRELLRTEAVAAAAVREIDALFKPLAGWSLWEAMMAPESESRMARTEVAQPANFALQLALVHWWELHGIRPSAVVGHSVGEVASAFVAGVYSLEDAVHISYHRSRLQQTMVGRGAMLAVGLPEPEALKWIQNEAGISIAAVNSFEAVTLSGDAASLEKLATALTECGVFNKFLRVEVAYHSPQMDPLREELLEALKSIRPQKAVLPLYSTADGRASDGTQWNADYWWRNVRQPVRFAHAVQALMEDGFSCFLEIGPHPVLGTSLRECASHLEKKALCFHSLHRKEPETRRLLLSAAELYCAGIEPEWTALAPDRGRFIPGPAYSWQRERHWLESDRSRMERLGLLGPVYLHRTIPAPLPTWEVEINRNFFPFLFDHGVEDQTVFAGMGFLEAAISTGLRVSEKSALVLENIAFEKVLIIDPSKLQSLVTQFDPGNGQFTISSRIDGEENSFQRHCRGRIFPVAEPAPGALDLDKWENACTTGVSLDAYYARLRTRGLFYGPTFRPTTNVKTGDGKFVIRMATGSTAGDLHPTLFDAALQAVLFCAEGDRLFVPFSFDRFDYHGPPDGEECIACGHLISQSETLIVADVWLASPQGRVFAHAHRVLCQRIETSAAGRAQNLLYETVWEESPIPAVEGGSGLVIVGPTSSPLVDALRKLSPNSRLIVSGGSISADGPIVFIAEHEPGTGYDKIASLSARFIELVQSTLVQAPAQAEITIVTRMASEPNGCQDLAASSLAALGLVAQNESDFLVCRSVDFSTEDPATAAKWILSEVAAGSRGDVAYRDGVRFAKVLRPLVLPAEVPSSSVSLDEPVALHFSSEGRLGSLHFEKTEYPDPAPGELLIRVHRVGLNYKDVLKVEGRLHPLAQEGTFNGPCIGMECSGVVQKVGTGSTFAPGDRVVTMMRDGFRSHVLAPEVFTVLLPENMGDEAAGVPVAWLTAYRGLVDVASLKTGERILIHHGTGGVGLAAIEIARHCGAEIFATAGSEEKRRILRSLGIDHVFSSRDLDFATGIRKATGGEGIDVVLGAQTGQALHAGLSLLRSGGRYIEIGKRDIAEDSGLPMRAFHRNITFASVDIDRLMAERPELIGSTLRKIFKHLAEGLWDLTPSCTFPAAEIRKAFEEMARSRQVGKLLVDFDRGSVDVHASKDRAAIRSDGCYLITGGTSGFGLLTAQWLAERGAGRIILASRSGRAAPGLEEALRKMTARCAVEVMAVDITNPVSVRALIQSASTHSQPLRGIIHGAMVLDDGLIREVTRERLHRVLAPKVAGALAISEALDTAPDLDFLVFSSSVSAVVGNPGQAAYVAANRILDALAVRLRAKGIPARSINWGALAESGVVARDAQLSSLLAAAGITGLTNAQVFSTLEELLRHDRPQTGVFSVDWRKWHEANPSLRDDPRFRDLRGGGDDAGNDVATALRRELSPLSRERKLHALEDHLRDVLARTLKMQKDSVPLNRRLNDMGVDSLMVLELGLGIKERLGVHFSAMEFLKGPTLEQLALLTESKLWSR